MLHEMLISLLMPSFADDPCLPLDHSTYRAHQRPDSTLKQPPLFNLEALQYPIPDLLTIPHQLRDLTLALPRLLILARIVRDIDRDHQIGALLLQTQQHEMDVDEFRDFAAGVRVRWRCLDEAECVDWLVAVVAVSGRTAREYQHGGRGWCECGVTCPQPCSLLPKQDSPQLCHDCAALLEDVCAVLLVDEVGEVVL